MWGAYAICSTLTCREQGVDSMTFKCLFPSDLFYNSEFLPCFSNFSISSRLRSLYIMTSNPKLLKLLARSPASLSVPLRVPIPAGKQRTWLTAHYTTQNDSRVQRQMFKFIIDKLQQYLRDMFLKQSSSSTENKLWDFKNNSMFSARTYLILKKVPSAPCNTGPLRMILLLLVMQCNTGTKHPMENLLKSVPIIPSKRNWYTIFGENNLQVHRKNPTSLIITWVFVYLETTCGLES